MVGEIWTYKATKPSDGMEKVRPVLVIGDDGDNELKFVDITYVIISSSASCGKYDVEISEEEAYKIGLDRKSIIKTTKIYTGPRTKLGSKIGDLTTVLRDDFIKRYKEYQKSIISKW